ncbi:GlxA family transcriptional regulator [Rhodovibrionaceae bacterium A322]
MERYGLLLIEGFDLESFATCVDALKAANDLAGETLYDWKVVGEYAAPVTSHSGISLPVQVVAGEGLPFDCIVIFAAEEALTYDSREVLAWLRRAVRFGAEMGGVDCGAWVLAKAGLLKDKRVALHWPYAGAFRETFSIPVDLRDTYALDKGLFTCGRGTSVFEMVLARIEQNQGKELAEAVAQDRSRDPGERGSPQQQRAGLSQRLGAQNAKLSACLDAMEANIDAPLSNRELAETAGVSVRHLERLFAAHFQEAPAQFYRNLRLEQARRLLSQTQMPITDIAMATGFVNVSHFARAFREVYETSPSQLRNQKDRQSSLQYLRRLA